MADDHLREYEQSRRAELRERWQADFALGQHLRVPNPHAFAELAACCTQDGEPLTTAQAVAKYEARK